MKWPLHKKIKCLILMFFLISKTCMGVIQYEKSASDTQVGYLLGAFSGAFCLVCGINFIVNMRQMIRGLPGWQADAKKTMEYFRDNANACFSSVLTNKDSNTIASNEYNKLLSDVNTQQRYAKQYRQMTIVSGAAALMSGMLTYYFIKNVHSI